MYFQVKQEHQDNAGSDEKRGAPEARWEKLASLFYWEEFQCIQSKTKYLTLVASYSELILTYR